MIGGCYFFFDMPTTDETQPLKEGWAWPSDNYKVKAHYFVGARSLCGRWGFFGVLEAKNQCDTDEPLDYDCCACHRAAKKRRAKKA